MDLPIDISALKKAANDIQNASDTVIKINIYYEETANSGLVELVKCLFASDNENAHVVFSMLDSSNMHVDKNINKDIDFSIIISGDGAATLQTYKELYSKKVPRVILSLTPHEVIDRAVSDKYKILKNDIIFPNYKYYSKMIDEDGYEVIDIADFNEDMQKDIQKKLTKWVYSLVRKEKLAFASKLYFLREKTATKIIQATSVQNAGVGVAFFMPGADMPLMTINQAKMVLELAALYGFKVDKERIPEMVVLVFSALLLKWLSGKVKEKVFSVGPAVNAVFGYFGSLLIGYIASAYFKNGTDLIDCVKSIGNISYKALELANKKIGFGSAK